MGECNHDFSERESSVATEGYCPICMAEDNKRLRELNAEMLAALQRIDGINDNPAIYNPDIEVLIRDALNAVAKATGGE